MREEKYIKNKQRNKWQKQGITCSEAAQCEW